MVEEGETGFMVEPGDVEGLAKAIGRLAADSELRHRLGSEGARRARSDFSFDLHPDRMERVLIETAAIGCDRKPGEEKVDDHL